MTNLKPRVTEDRPWIRPQTAECFAAVMLAGVRDKAGKPLINHCIRVANTAPIGLQIPALLHDVAEDAMPGNEAAVLEKIRIFFGDDVAEIVDCLTRRKGEQYHDFIRRCAKNEGARLIKIADLSDNLSAERKASCSESLEIRYRKALEFLQERDGAEIER